jgi:hypothetical protein
MSDTTTILRSVGIAKDATFQTICKIAQDEESILGPIVGIGHGPLMGADGKSTSEEVTVLTMDMAQAPPEKAVILRMCIGSTAPTVGGATLIGTGHCYVTGQLIALAVFRPT